jgi:predicted TIM-barrel fold metal-dependent hydrolase
VKTPTFDCHVHLRNEAEIDRLGKLAARLGVSGMNLVSTSSQARINDNPPAFLAKSRRPEFFRVFAGLDHCSVLSGGAVASPPLAEQVERLAEIGADGVKLIETKPTSRKGLDIPIDGDYYAPMFARLEELSLPLLWHVADPEEFWDPDLTPRWAAERGWGYDASFVPKEQLYSEVENVLVRHPGLKVIFPHFYFLSADLERAAGLLADHPGVSLDLAPGIELYYNLSRDAARSREFFLEHAGRTLFGTDLGITPGEPIETSAARVNLVAMFLETAEEFRLPPEADLLLGPPEDGVVRGLELPEEALAKICRTNFLGIAGAEPRGFDAGLAAEECRRLAAEAEALPDAAESAVQARRIAGLLPAG